MWLETVNESQMIKGLKLCLSLGNKENRNSAGRLKMHKEISI